MEETSPKPFVLVLMPFSDGFKDIYEVGIKAACRDAGAYCERVDEQLFEGSILERIYHQIRTADIIVADMTGRNPNVFYEVGYAHALNKRVILLTRSTEDIPFDLKHYPHIVYGDSIHVLKRDLETRIVWSIENPKQSLSAIESKPEFFISGKPLVDSPLVSFKWMTNAFTEPSLRLQIDIRNPTPKILNADAYTLALLTPRGIVVSDVGNVISISRLPDGRQLLTFDKAKTLFPDAWCSLWLAFSPDQARNDVAMCLRLFTELGTQDFPFTIRMTESSAPISPHIGNGVRLS